MSIQIDDVIVLHGDRYVVTSVGRNVYHAVGLDNPKIKCKFTREAVGITHISTKQEPPVHEEEDKHRNKVLNRIKLRDYWENM
jgi:hypothetical protein